MELEFRDGTIAQVVIGEFSMTLSVFMVGVKQGRVIAALIFNLFVTCSHYGVSQLGSSIFADFGRKTKTSSDVIFDLHYADDAGSLGSG